jgi:hypothetical protein
MADTTTDSTRRQAGSKSWVWHRFGGFVLLYLASLGTFSILAYGLRWLIAAE